MHGVLSDLPCLDHEQDKVRALSKNKDRIRAAMQTTGHILARIAWMALTLQARRAT